MKWMKWNSNITKMFILTEKYVVSSQKKLWNNDNEILMPFENEISISTYSTIFGRMFVI